MCKPNIELLQVMIWPFDINGYPPDQVTRMILNSNVGTALIK
jgi:hypothetical protein